MRRRSRSVFGLGALFVALAATTCAAAEKVISRIEVRLVAKDGGESFSFATGEKFNLEADPVLMARHFTGVARDRKRNPNLPGTVDLELLYDERGKARFIAIANAARDRQYCLLIDDLIQHCAAFPPLQKGLYERGQILSSIPERDARQVAARLAAAIRKANASLRATERTVPASSPKALLDSLYRRAMKSGTPDWLDGERRGAYLASALLDLWDGVDVAQASGNRDAPLDADPVAATNGLTLQSYRIGTVKQADGVASVTVVLTYREPTHPKPVTYTLAKEKGRWRIADIEYNTTTLSQQLAIYLSAALPGEGRR